MNKVQVQCQRLFKKDHSSFDGFLGGLLWGSLLGVLLGTSLLDGFLGDLLGGGVFLCLCSSCY
jgi:predicted lipid-binding transport protein (Tim44 family)